MFSIKKEIGRNELIPRWYGVAYQDYRRMVFVCYPLILNVIVGIFRAVISEIKISFIWGSGDEGHMRIVEAAYWRGVREARLSKIQNVPLVEGRLLRRKLTKLIRGQR